MTPSLPAEYFDGLYAESEDPWQISSGWYERRKRALVMACLPEQRFAVAFEPGCSNGELTVELAPRCDRLVAWDVADAAVQRTRERTADLAGVDVRRGTLPGYWPDEQADLIVLGELGYYFDAGDLARILDAALGRLAPGATLLAVHWRHDAPDYPLRGDDVHELIAARSELHHLGGYRDEDFLLDVWTVGDTGSVARRAGVLSSAD